MNTTTNNVLEIHQAFYDAFAAGNYAELEKLWARVDRISVFHPSVP